MPVYARVEDGVVVELWPHDPDAPMPDPQPEPSAVFAPDIADKMFACDAEVKEGWLYDGKVFAEPPAPPTQPPIVPNEVTNWQARAALHDAGLFDQVDAAVKAAAAQYPKISYAWEYGNTFLRSSEFIVTMAAQLGLSSQQIDDLFVAAAAEQ